MKGYLLEYLVWAFRMKEGISSVDKQESGQVHKLYDKLIASVVVFKNYERVFYVIYLATKLASFVVVELL